MSKTKILITGAGGFLGSRIYREYKNKYDITALTAKDLDVTDYEAVSFVLEKVKPDIIFHGAAISATKACEDNPQLAYRVNVEGSVNIAKIARKIGAKMLFVSSEQVFNGNVNDGPYSEEDEAIPNTVYGQTKLEAERLLRQEIDELWILRLSWMFGLPERNVPNNPNLFWKIVCAVMSDKQIKIASNEYRGITYVYDLIDNLENIFELPYGTYHFGSENEQSTYDTAVFILERIGLSKEKIDRIVIRDEDKYKDKKRDLRMSYEKIKSFGININTSQQSIERALKEFDFKF
ncbi:dTDP-4-dehydrorhamnose reductase [Caloranaerobacter azorensis DSM 13643]|uniref:dTDP-4-dehydrorhamnose reductase n=1 Tax=Caloranaerobacter azorensis DSM 13643 TaxID=1121264 RepID=A0A1M5VGM1_9FIRM|nr:NAD(P)-dependent oxidoreductase [Caloranaerobacter azorensis]SHH74399.1 dTDP-4-dehydrorhamnose reductase [Caloranaerobacter azorensis DSM 13643]